MCGNFRNFAWEHRAELKVSAYLAEFFTLTRQGGLAEAYTEETLMVILLST
jgi:hypothetical protein